jgi:hypothetical protein
MPDYNSSGPQSHSHERKANQTGTECIVITLHNEYKGNAEKTEGKG